MEFTVQQSANSIAPSLNEQGARPQIICERLEDLPANYYGLVLADPPWQWKSYSHKGEGRSPQAHFVPMNVADIKALPVGRIAAPNAVLVMWAYAPMLPDALEVMADWGFEYSSTCFVWAKCQPHDKTKFHFGGGFTTRKECEFCYIGKRGQPKRLSASVHELIIAPRRLPMQKPDEQYDRLEQLYPGPRIELFARQTRPGWDAWGDQVGLLDHGPVCTRRFPSASALSEAEGIAMGTNTQD